MQSLQKCLTIFFDCLNVNSFDEGKHQRKPFKDPYRSVKDFRLKVDTSLKLRIVRTSCMQCPSLQYACAVAEG